MARARSLTDAGFRDAVVGSPIPVLVFFWAQWNATCKAFAPTLDVLAEEYAGRVDVVRLEVDANPATPASRPTRSRFVFRSLATTTRTSL